MHHSNASRFYSPSRRCDDSYRQFSTPTQVGILAALAQQKLETLERISVQIPPVHCKFEDGTGKHTVNIEVS